MSGELILSFPVLQPDGGGFLESVIYTVEARRRQNARKITITHTLKNESFIAELIKNNKAKFSVSLLYKGSAERQKIVFDECVFDEATQTISAEQTIGIDFGYSPKIIPCIVAIDDAKIIVDSKSGLTDFWKGETFEIPAYSRIAHHTKLTFSSSDVSSLVDVKCEPSYTNGSIKTIVVETVGEGEQPITITCAQDVYDELKKGVTDSPTDAKTAMRASIITQVLCHVYAYMNNLEGEQTEIHPALLEHMESVEEKTGESWMGDSDFNASFAATKMMPYAIEALNSEDQ